ncbi:FAD:protein FMN transferase, partial [Oleiphilus sp. HI0123]
MPLKAEWHEFSAEVMTTNLSLEFWLDDKIKAEKAKRAVLNRFNDIEAKMSRYISESELSKVNRLASEQTLVISTELFSLLEKSLSVSALSQGAFDISFASVGFLYDYRQHAQPSDSQISAKLPVLDYRHIVLN